MLTYRLQDRIFETEGGSSLSFPNTAIINFLLKPAVPFGGVKGPSRNVVGDMKAFARFNATTGRTAMEKQDGPLFEPLDVSLKLLGISVRVAGNNMSVESHCTSLTELHQLVTALFHIIPSVLNLHIPDSPVITQVTGEVGGQQFKWNYDPTELRLSTVVTSKEGQEKIVVDSWLNLTLFDDGSNRRLMASLHYFHNACRLLEAGFNRFEFLAEAVLNFSRSMQAIFGESRDNVREEIHKLEKYSDDEIEARFITALVLRSYFDVAHISLSVLDREQLQTIKNYCRIAEQSIRKLLQSVMESIADGTYVPREDTPPTLSKDKAAILKTIRANLDGVDADP